MTITSRIEAVIFDWGGTLSQWAEVDLDEMWGATARRLNEADEARLVAALIDAEAAFWRGVRSSQTSRTLSEVVAVAAEELQLEVTEALLEEAAHLHLDKWTEYVVHDPDVPGVLRALKQRGLKTGLLSNTIFPGDWHDELLRRDGIADLLDVRFYTSDMPRTKPHPSVFRTVLDALDVGDPAAAIYVGDRPYDDISGAKGAGMRAVLRPNPAIPDYRGGPDPDAVIHDLPSLVTLIDAGEL